jgi:hypothetical protein
MRFVIALLVFLFMGALSVLHALLWGVLVEDWTRSERRFFLLNPGWWTYILLSVPGVAFSAWVAFDVFYGGVS